METKQQIRKQGLAARSNMPQILRRQYDSVICENLKAYVKQRGGEFLKRGAYGYYPHGSEVNLIGLYNWLLAQNIPMAFPRVFGEAMEFYQIPSMDAFETGACGRNQFLGQSRPVLTRRFVLYPAVYLTVQETVTGTGRAIMTAILAAIRGCTVSGLLMGYR